MLKDRCLLIAGGTGPFGKAEFGGFLRSASRGIHTLGRDEKSQPDVPPRHAHPKSKLHRRDARHFASLQSATRDVGSAFHVATPERVSYCAPDVTKAARTKIRGTGNPDKATYSASAQALPKALNEVVITRQRPADEAVGPEQRSGRIP
ncbi:polysaccharide biosynthesis protein [Pseudomonas sp.]|uniref:polysaccharide biosynthesis protein n=1 Tax=Pseudomonas sp. TaxID=306 RepID=UPI0028AD1836|nr:polysaccharide biosynthesis protein [Pseudomonas sp.]